MLRTMSELNLMQIHSSVLLLGIVLGKKNERSILKTSCFQKGYYVLEIIIGVDHVFLWRPNFMAPIILSNILGNFSTNCHFQLHSKYIWCSMFFVWRKWWIRITGFKPSFLILMNNLSSMCKSMTYMAELSNKCISSGKICL